MESIMRYGLQQDHNYYQKVISDGLKDERRQNKMGTLKEEAQAYEPQQTLNIADLEEVPIDLVLVEKEGKNSDGEAFKYKCIALNDKEYRVPNSVLDETKKILKLKPTVTKIKVLKKGTGLATRYEVEALD